MEREVKQASGLEMDTGFEALGLDAGPWGQSLDSKDRGVGESISLCPEAHPWAFRSCWKSCGGNLEERAVGLREAR